VPLFKVDSYLSVHQYEAAGVKLKFKFTCSLLYRASACLCMQSAERDIVIQIQIYWFVAKRLKYKINIKHK